VESGLLLTSCCSTARRERCNQGQPELLLLQYPRLLLQCAKLLLLQHLGRGMSRKYSGYRISWL
jgi:hypothetical protein